MSITPLLEILRNYFKTSDAVFKSDLVGKTLHEILQVFSTVREHSVSITNTVTKAEPKYSKISPWLCQSAEADQGLPIADVKGEVCSPKPAVDVIDCQALGRFADHLRLAKIIRNERATLFVFNADSSAVAFEASFHIRSVEEALKNLPFKNIRVKVTRS